MERYESYKDSGVKWLGEIPGHWEVRKIKYTFKERSQKGFPKLPLLSATQQYGVIKKDDYENRTVVATKGLETLKLVCKNDFVISLRSFEGGIEMSHEEGIISPAYTILIPKKIEPSFFRHLGKSPVFINLLKMMVTGIREGQNIDYNKLRTNLIPIPPKAEQTAIANYLDSVTSKIDEAISQQQKMIDLLNERKQIIIQNAVTKGLDPNAKMKDSGVEWIGEIPEDWEVTFIKYLGSTNKKLINPQISPQKIWHEYSMPAFDDGEQPQDVLGSNIDSAKIELNEATLLVNKLNVHKRRVWYVKDPLANSVASTEFVPISITKANPYFIRYVIISDFVTKQLINSSNGSTNSQKRVSPNIILGMKIPLPPIDQQQDIVDSIESNIEPLCATIFNYQQQISLLQERKQIIINDVVTGKVKVI